MVGSALNQIHEDVPFLQWLKLTFDSIDIEPEAYVGFSNLLGFLVVFRTSQAYSRFWDGATVVHQMLSGWWDACSALMAFCDNSGKKAEEVEEFKHITIRMFSMMSALALAQLRDKEMNCKFEVEVIDAAGIDKVTMETLGDLRCSPELVMYWIEALSAQAIRTGIIDMPPPIVTRAFQELAIGMNHFKDACKIATVPFPFPYSQAATLLLVVHFILTPLVLITWTEAIFTAGLFCTVQVLIFWMLHAISEQLENPFGDDANDLELSVMQQEFNRHLLLFLDERVQQQPRLVPQEGNKEELRMGKTTSSFVFEHQESDRECRLVATLSSSVSATAYGRRRPSPPVEFGADDAEDDVTDDVQQVNSSTKLASLTPPRHLEDPNTIM